MHVIPLQILKLEQESYHILVEVNFLGTIHKMVVDTGASKTVFDRSMLIQAGIAESDFRISEVLSTGLGTNEMKSETLQLNKFNMSHWSCNMIEVTVLDLSSINYAYNQMGISPIIGVLGGDILLNYGGVINYKKETLTLNRIKRKKLSKESKGLKKGDEEK